MIKVVTLIEKYRMIDRRKFNSNSSILSAF